MFELKQNRTLSITIGKRALSYVIRPITREEWFAYFDAVTVEQEQKGEEVVNTSEVTAARLELLAKVLVEVHGYDTPGGTPVIEIPGWQSKLPTAHRVAIVDMLFEVGRDEKAAWDAFSIGEERVTLKAFSTATDNRMVQERGLVHIFAVPSVEQHRTYSRDSSRSVITGGRQGRTRFLGAQRTLVALYDELIVRVEGYSVGGEQVFDRKDVIASSMDSYHKAQAMGMVFAPADVDAE